MAIKKALFNIKGMTRDLAASKFSPQYAYENHNLRIVATDNNDTLSLVNEKGNVVPTINWNGSHNEGNYVFGTPIGQEILDNNLILFTAGEDNTISNISATVGTDITVGGTVGTTVDIDSEYEDRIYKFQLNEANPQRLVGTKLFRGDLNFNTDNPIETLGLYENENLEKVYWVDGLNQPRVINIQASTAKRNAWVDDSFNFIRNIQLKESISISRNLVASGSFAPGVLQYCFTYFNLYGQESNIFYTSPLFYVSYNNRGASAEDTVSNSFNIAISLPDASFEYVRIYAILRTSLNGTPQVRKVVDIAVPQTSYTIWQASTVYTTSSYVLYQGKLYKCKTAHTSSSSFQSSYWTQYFAINYIDNGATGETIDPTELLYKGGEEIFAGTLSQKDNTLFLGDVSYTDLNLSSSLQTTLRSYAPSFTNGDLLDVLGEHTGYYTYDNQLKFNSGEIKGFKFLEYYRFGLQFQYKTGKWSSPVWLGDVYNNTTPVNTEVFYSTYGTFPGRWVRRPIASSYISNTSLLTSIYNLGYVRVRPVVVFPSITDRECVCQGILCPTVYNAEDRLGNAPFVQSSWFARPNPPCDLSRETQSTASGTGNWLNYDNPFTIGIESKSGAVCNNNKQVNYISGSTTTPYYMDIVSRGAWAEFRHNTALPDNSKRNAELQCIEATDSPIYPAITRDSASSISAASAWASNHKEIFFVDQSILTFHSPDIEFNKEIRSLDSSNLKLRIVGAVPLTAFISSIDIQTSTPPMNMVDDGEGVFPGFYKEPIGTRNVSTQGWKALLSAPMWVDGCAGKEYSPKNGEFGWMYVIYPWQRNGSLNNTKSADTSGYTPAMLSQKKMANARFSYTSLYYGSSGACWKAEVSGSATKTGITGVQIFDSNELSVVKLPAQDDGLPDITYYGNVDKIITYPTTDDKKDGYTIMVSGYGDVDTSATSMYEMFSAQYRSVQNGYVSGTERQITSQYKSNAPISMKYKSTPHAVLALRNSIAHKQRILPTFTDVESFPGSTITRANNQNSVVGSDKHFFWDRDNIITGADQDYISFPSEGSLYAGQYFTTRFGFLWLGELYNDTITSDIRFGGQTQEALENNQWVVGGEPVSLVNDDGTVKTAITIKWTEGDTYYQRYDCLKTYPFTSEDQNSITDIVSFMCETRENIDGRYDRNRGQIDNLAVTPENFNLLNPVYTQENNFFSYRSKNTNKLSLNSFHNTVTWTKTKTLGEDVDTWTNITLASILDLDGDKGPVRAIRNFNNNLLAFQDNGISQILYNENVQIASSTGIPIEIANSGKVSGKRYITNHIGCTNKWSICSTPNGLYFLDSLRKDFYLFNGQQFSNLSDTLGFHSWVVNTISNNDIWNPVDYGSYRTLYDRINGDVLITTEDTALAYSEQLQQFSSFYDYGDTPYFGNLEDVGIAWHKYLRFYAPWLHRQGEYNKFFGEYKPFWTTVIVNPDPTEDKIFNNLEYRADGFSGDTYKPNYSFNYLRTWNEYQEGEANLGFNQDVPANLKKKFRVWRANIPRWNVNKNGQTANKRDRMRNPWLYLQLKMQGDNVTTNYKTVLHDLVVDYFE